MTRTTKFCLVAGPLAVAAIVFSFSYGEASAPATKTETPADHHVTATEPIPPSVLANGSCLSVNKDGSLAFAKCTSTLCLAVSSAKIIPAKCATGTCSFGPGVNTAVDLKQALLPTFEVSGLNMCSETKTAEMLIDFAFYNAAIERLGYGRARIGPLDPGEKFKHRYEVPEDVRGSGVPVSVRVKEITEVK